VQAIRSANVRADAIVLNSELSAYARNRPPLRTPARQCRAICKAGAFRPPRSLTASSRRYVVIWRSLRAPSGPDGMDQTRMRLYRDLLLEEPRVAQVGRKAVEETLVHMEAANKVMHRQGRVYLI